MFACYVKRGRAHAEDRAEEADKADTSEVMDSADSVTDVSPHELNETLF